MFLFHFKLNNGKEKRSFTIATWTERNIAERAGQRQREILQHRATGGGGREGT